MIGIRKYDFEFNPTISILKNGTYQDYLEDKSLNSEDFLICPTDAIDSTQKKINAEKCVECMFN